MGQQQQRGSATTTTLTLLLIVVVLFGGQSIFMSTITTNALSSSSAPPSQQQPSLLVVGGSGGTGWRALQGLVDVGYTPSDIRVLTRNTNKPSMVSLRKLGFQTFQANLDDNDDNSNLQEATRGCIGCYVHSTSSDTKTLDKGEVGRAQNLVSAIVKRGHVRTVVYNSAVSATDDPPVRRIEQKHDVEQVFIRSCDNQGIDSFTSLRANLFMEELWKDYTRPSILHRGKYPFAVPSDRPIYLTSVRDMGRLAGSITLQQRQSSSSLPVATTTGTTNIINVASDVLTPVEMANAFANAQNTPCRHVDSKFLRYMARFFFKDLYQVIQFYRLSKETTDIDELRHKFPNVTLTSFATFLEETNWGNPNRTYDDLTIVTANH